MEKIACICMVNSLFQSGRLSSFGNHLNFYFNKRLYNTLFSLFWDRKYDHGAIYFWSTQKDLQHQLLNDLFGQSNVTIQKQTNRKK